MACLQGIQSDSEFDLSMRWLCCSAELCISDSTFIEGDSGIDFEFAAPAPSLWDDALTGLMKAAEDLIQDGKICPISQSTPDIRAVKNEYEVGNKGIKIAEYLRMNQTARHEDLHQKLVSPPPKKKMSWKEILGFKKPKFLRSKSASRAEKATSEARDPWLGRAGSESKITSGSPKKDDSGSKHLKFQFQKADLKETELGQN